MEEHMTKRKTAAQKTRKRIIEACRKLIREKGFDHISVDDIATEAGVAKGSFYTYFKRKEDVIEALTESDFYRLAELADAVPDRSLPEKLRWYCHEFLSMIEAGGVEVVRQWIRNNVSPTPIPGKTDLTKYQFDDRAVCAMLTAAQERGELRRDAPAEELAVLINSQLYGLMLVWCMSGEAVVGSEWTDRFCNELLTGALARWINQAS